MASIKRRLAAVVIAVAALAPALPAHAADGLQLIEQQIEAGLLYNFLKYTEWPAKPAGKPDAPIVVCLFGGDPFAGYLQPMVGRSVNQQVIAIQDLRGIEELHACSLLFVHASEKQRWPDLRTALAMKPILTVSDFAGFAEAGGMIEFTRADNRVGIKIDTNAVSAARLQVGERLLKLATPVRPSAEER